jgi:hypothetical protein
MPPVPLPDGQTFNSEDFITCKIEQFYGGKWYVYVQIKNARQMTLEASSREEAVKIAGEIGNKVTRLQLPGSGRISRQRLKSGGTGTTIFIGHGHSSVWRELQVFLEKRLRLSVEEFNSVSVAGIPTANRLEEMLNDAAFAFLVMTAEDEMPDGKLQARLNVVHEAGLFQGKLGFKKAIILLEDGCEDFSNIHGLGRTHFPKSNIAAKFEEIRAVLEREHVIAPA